MMSKGVIELKLIVSKKADELTQLRRNDERRTSSKAAITGSSARKGT
jgi:hypothetical protein